MKNTVLYQQQDATEYSDQKLNLCSSDYSRKSQDLKDKTDLTFPILVPDSGQHQRSL